MYSHYFIMITGISFIRSLYYTSLFIRDHLVTSIQYLKGRFICHYTSFYIISNIYWASYTSLIMFIAYLLYYLVLVIVILRQMTPTRHILYYNNYFMSHLFIYIYCFFYSFMKILTLILDFLIACI